MDKRTFLALVLTAIVIVVTPLIFQSKPTATTTGVVPDSSIAALQPDSNSALSAAAAATPAPTAALQQPRGVSSPAATPATTLTADTTSITEHGVTYEFSSVGAAPVSISMADTLYPNLRPGVADQGVSLRQNTGELLSYSIVTGADTIVLDTIAFESTQSANAITYTSLSEPTISLSYSAGDQAFVSHVSGTVEGVDDAKLLIRLPQHIHSSEVDTLDDYRHLAFGYKLMNDGVESMPFGKFDIGEVKADSTPKRWVAIRNKYFLLALISPDSASAFGILTAHADSVYEKTTVRATAVVSAPVSGGTFEFNIFAGPQSWQAMHGVGYELENVNPYAGWLHGVVQPFATVVMRILLWMKATLQVNYGWVLVIFGVLVRLLLWPLNQTAMRSSIKMQRLQPEMAEVQKRYKSDPEKQREAIVKLYQEHGMSPFSPVLGCLPMLIPMPVLFALYFVFQNTIEFRGVSFLWLPDLSLMDPFYITPIVMGISMFVLSWIGMRGVPPTPQTRMMAYMMPAVMTVMFLKFPSGLNLYYAVQNIASLPQQWIVANERAKAGVTRKAGTGGKGGGATAPSRRTT